MPAAQAAVALDHDVLIGISEGAAGGAREIHVFVQIATAVADDVRAIPSAETSPRRP